MMPIVSIIMPAHNAANFICESIHSVINQGTLNWELIIVDDYSTDNTLTVIRHLLNDERIKLIKNRSNLGGAVSRNVAIAAAKGRYIAFLDSDDLWHESKLDSHIKFMEVHNIGFTYSNYKQFYNDKNNTLIIAPTRVNYEQMLKSNFIGCLTVVYDTSYFGKFYFPDTKKRHDFGLWLNMLKKFDYAHNIGEVLANYRVHNASLSSNKKDAFQSYFHILYNLQNLGYFRSVCNTVIFTLLSLAKKKLPSIYPSLVSIFISKLSFKK